jgi:hypothetical protein
VKPKKIRALTFGQPPTSAPSAADQAFISSEMAGNVGREDSLFLTR